MGKSLEVGEMVWVEKVSSVDSIFFPFCIGINPIWIDMAIFQTS